MDFWGLILLSTLKFIFLVSFAYNFSCVLRTFYIVDPFRSLFVLRSFRLVCAPDKLTLSLFLRSFYSSSISHTYSCLLLRASNKLILSISFGVLFSMHFTNYHYLSAATSYLLRPFLISHVNSHRTSFARS